MHEARVAPESLRRRFDPAELGFETTEEIEPHEGMIGQPRAQEALDFGLEISAPGYNIYAAGPIGTGRRTMIEGRLRARAADRPAAGDWLYLFNFGAEGRPLAVRVPSGSGETLVGEMRDLIAECREQVERAFDSEEYERRRQQVLEEVGTERDAALADLRSFASGLGLALELTPAGLLTVPIVEGKPVAPSEFGKLAPEQRADYAKHSEQVEQRMPAVKKRMRELERAGRARLRELDREVALFAIGHLIDELRERHLDSEGVARWLNLVKEDMIENLGQFRQNEDEPALPGLVVPGMGRARQEAFSRYEPNAFVVNRPEAGAPVVVETNPTYYNLFGRIEYEAAFGAVVTGHHHLRPGALHRANGGYLLLNALDVLREPFVWPRLKEVLRTRRIGIENIGTQLTLFPTVTLEPDAIELDVKVVMVGPPALYSLLYALDEDVRKLFKVKAEFDSDTALDPDRAREYGAFIRSRIDDERLAHFSREAVARVLEYCLRRAGDREKLTLRFADIADLVSEAGYWAGTAGATLVGPEHVDEAIERKARRSNLLEQRIRALIAEGTLVIDLDGSRVGQVNGLSVSLLGDYEFGRPVRITAATGLGAGEVLNVERETDLSGPIHSKGFLILAGFLRGRFGSRRPLSLGASIVFEQSYEEVEGDSASSAELYALLSSLAGAPIKQGIAVTGSVDQHGRIQPVGAINEKVEGFYRVCEEAAPNGERGVIVPAANLRHLMLGEEVVEAVRQGSFNVWAANSIDEGIEILTGVSAGEEQADGSYPDGSINGRVDARLSQLAESARRYQRPIEQGAG